jgi:2-keto-4-pentenoate hydratase/2-oxohepta-3-ene-1,7-dioic acid hydratase in catechol pathway
MINNLARFSINGRVCWGVIHDGEVYEIKGSVFGNYKITDQSCPVDNIKILVPFRPSKIIAVGRNYKDHAKEKNVEIPIEPRIFLKAPSSLVATNEVIKIPYSGHIVEHEAELAFVVRKKAQQVSINEAHNYILGYTCSNDVSDRTIQLLDGIPDRAKSFDTFTPVGPWITTGIDPSSLSIECRVNAELRQASNTAHMMYDVPTLLSYISCVMTLYPGDMIMTGTPGGTSPIYPGDYVEIFIEGIGALRNPVIASL